MPQVQPGPESALTSHPAPPRTPQGDVAGRLCRYDPATLRTDVLLTGLWFANGVALAADKSYVAVVETNRLRVHRWDPAAGRPVVCVSLHGAGNGE